MQNAQPDTATILTGVLNGTTPKSVKPTEQDSDDDFAAIVANIPATLDPVITPPHQTIGPFPNHSEVRTLGKGTTAAAPNTRREMIVDFVKTAPDLPILLNSNFASENQSKMPVPDGEICDVPIESETNLMEPVGKLYPNITTSIVHKTNFSFDAGMAIPPALSDPKTPAGTTVAAGTPIRHDDKITLDRTQASTDPEPHTNQKPDDVSTVTAENTLVFADTTMNASAPPLNHSANKTPPSTKLPISVSPSKRQPKDIVAPAQSINTTPAAPNPKSVPNSPQHTPIPQALLPIKTREQTNPYPEPAVQQVKIQPTANRDTPAKVPLAFPMSDSQQFGPAAQILPPAKFGNQTNAYPEPAAQPVGIQTSANSNIPTNLPPAPPMIKVATVTSSKPVKTASSPVEINSTTTTPAKSGGTAQDGAGMKQTIDFLPTSTKTPDNTPSQRARIDPDPQPTPDQPTPDQPPRDRLQTDQKPSVDPAIKKEPPSPATLHAQPPDTGGMAALTGQNTPINLPTKAHMPPPQLADHIAHQITAAVQKSPQGPIELSLHPQELGRVKLTLQIQDGSITVSIIAENAETTDLMRRHIDTLTQKFGSIGFENINYSFGKQGGETAGFGANQHKEQRPPPTPPVTDDPLPENITHKTTAAPRAGLDLRI